MVVAMDTLSFKLRSTGGDHSLFIRPSQQCYFVTEKCLRRGRIGNIYIAKDRLALNRASAYLKVSIAPSSLDRIRLLTSFEYDGSGPVRFDDSEFHENTRTVQIMRAATKTKVWRYALLCNYTSTCYYVVTVDVSDKAQSASVALHGLLHKDRTTCEDQIRNLSLQLRRSL